MGLIAVVGGCVVEQQHKLHPVYDLHAQLLQQQSGNKPDYATKDVPEPGSASGYLETSDVPGFTPAAVGAPTVPPRVPVINHRSSISYRKIRPSDLEVLQEIHEALFPIK